VKVLAPNSFIPSCPPFRKKPATSIATVSA